MSRPLLPRPPPRLKPDVQSGHSGLTPNSSVQLPAKRKRAVAAACKYCRARKTKCDGLRPTCGPCNRARVDCEYDAPEGLSQREAEKKRLKELSQSKENLQSTLEILRHGSEADAIAALRRIRDAGQVEDAVTMIADAQALLPQTNSTSSASSSPPRRRAPSDLLLHDPTADQDYMFETRYSWTQERDVDKNVFINLAGQTLDIARWTTVSSDNRLMNHLLNLFFTWDNCMERMMYRPMFEEDLTSGPLPNDNTPRLQFCSAFLVNALLAMSCLHSLQSATFAQYGNPKSRGRQFVDEAEKLLQTEQKHASIPLFQGLFALFSYEGQLGSGAKAVQYFLQAIEVYNTLNATESSQPTSTSSDPARLRREKDGISWCMWGLYSMEWRSSQPMGFRNLVQEPRIAKSWNESGFAIADRECGSYWFYPYPMSLRAQPSKKVEVRDAELKLCDIVKDALDFLNPAEGSLPAVQDPQRALEFYDAIILWQDNLPLYMRREEAVLPSAIMIHVLAEYMLTVILRPFNELSRAEFGRFIPKQRCYSHASRLMATIWTYRAFAIWKTELWLMVPITTAALLVVHDLDPGSAELNTLLQACQCLHEMSELLPLAAGCLAEINKAFQRASHRLPANVERFFIGVREPNSGEIQQAVPSLMPSQIHSESKNESNTAFAGYLQELLTELESTTLD